MVLDSYTCEMCMLRQVETLRDLFLHCSFAKKLLGIHWSSSTYVASCREGYILNEEAH
jgi:hypothetical protein